MTLELGITHTRQITVTPENTADAYGNPGVRVFATPAMIHQVELTVDQCLHPLLPDGQASVGTAFYETRHLAATPIGMKIWIEVELIEIDRRRLLFAFELRDEVEVIGRGQHERFIIDSPADFVARVEAKKGQR